MNGIPITEKEWNCKLAEKPIRTISTQDRKRIIYYIDKNVEVSIFYYNYDNNKPLNNMVEAWQGGHIIPICKDIDPEEFEYIKNRAIEIRDNIQLERYSELIY